jgi:protease-4
MALEADLLIDRRRLKRRLAFWRVVAIVAVLAALFVGLGDTEVGGQLGGQRVARLSVAGTIGTDRRLIEAIDRVARDDQVRALVLTVDSPGGSVAGGEALHAALTRFRDRKPLVAVLTGTAASAGYMIALPAHRILAREGTVTGSIGVILQTVEASELLARLGIAPETIASGPLKDQPSPFRPLTEEGRAALRRVVLDLHDQFMRMVAAGRDLPLERVRPLADGRVFTGREAAANGLVDAIGGEREARQWLATARDVPETLPMRELTPRRDLDELLGVALGTALRSLLAEGIALPGWRIRGQFGA